MLRRARRSTVQAVVQSVGGAEQKTVAADKLRLTELELIKGVAGLEETQERLVGVIDYVLVKLYAVIYAVGTCKNKKEMQSLT